MTKLGYVAIGFGCVASGLASGAMIDLPGVGPASFEVWEARQTQLSAEDRTVYACDFSDGGDWIPSDAKGSTRSCVRLDDGGRHYVRLGGEGRNGFPNGVRSRNRVPVRRGETLKLSFDGRRVDAEGSFVMYLRAYDASGKNVSGAVEFGEGWAYSPYSKALYKRPTKGGVAGKWTRRECKVVVPDGVAAIVPYVCPWRGEHVDCADLRITRSPCVAVRRLELCARKSGDGRLELDGKDDSILLSASISTGTDGVSRIEAEVRDLSRPPRPRALQVVLAVERDLAGWTWHRNWRADAAVDASACLLDVEMLGGHRVSRYPFTAVSRDGRGIAIGTPFDAPVFEGRETTARGIRSTTIIGLLPRGNGIGTSARLRWIAFPFTGGWGFRSAAKVYYAANDGLVPKPRPGEKEGTWLWPVSPHAGPENPGDFGLTYWEAPTSVGARTNLVAAAHKLGIGVYPYTEAWGMRQPLKTLPDGGHPPVEERFAELSAWAKEDGTKETWFNAPRNVAAQAALNSLPVAPDGTHPYSEDKYGRWSHWWRTNADPRIGRPNRASLCWDYAAGKGVDIVDGVYLDSVSYGFACNFRNVRPEHLAVMDETLVYDSETGVPCADGIQHQVAFVSWLSRELHARGKRVFGNVFGIAHRFNATTVDIFGSEVGGWGTRHEKTGARTHMAIRDESAGERRFYAYHRPVSNLLQEGNFSTPARELTAEEVRRYVELQMFYGFYPGISTIGGETEPGYNNWRRYFDKTRACERDRQLFKAAIPLIRRLNRAGWMPEPLMRSGNACVWVERYGDAAAGDCLFTVRNNSASAVSTTLSAEVAVTLEAAWNGTGLEARPDGSWSVALRPWETAVFLARAKTTFADPSATELVERAGKGPSFLFTKDRLPEIRRRIAQDPDAAAWWREFRAHAEKAYVRPPVDIPDRGAQWYHYYSCRKCGRQLKPKSPTLHVCPVCGETHTGWPYDDAALFATQNRAAEAARDCALVYALDGSPAFAATARAYLTGLAAAYPAYLPHDKSGPGPLDISKRKRPRCGRAFSQALGESVWLIKLLQAYDCLGEALSAEERAAVKEKLFRPAADLIKRDGFGIHNHECWHLAAYGLAGLVLGDAQWVSDAIDSPTGVKMQLEKGILSDRCWFEGAWGYHFYTMNALAPFLTALSNLGYPPPARFKEMFDAPLGQVTPTWQLPAVNDTGRVSFPPGSYGDLYELAWTWWRDPVHAWWLAGRPRATRAYALQGTPIPKKPAPPALASLNYADSGMAILRGRTPGARGVVPDNYVAVDYGPHGGGHGHPDKLNLILWGRGEMIAEDPGCIAYGNPRHWEWYRATLAHNTVVMDGRNQKHATGRCLSFTVEDGVTTAEFDAGEAYPGARVRRAVALAGDVVLDVVLAEAPAEHQWEWAFHARHAVTTSVALADCPLPPPEVKPRKGFGPESDGAMAWNWATGVREGAFGGTWSATWRKADGQAALGVVQVVRDGETGAPASGTFRTAVASAQPPPQTFSLAVPRVKGRKVMFASVLLPGRAASTACIEEAVWEPDGVVRLVAVVDGQRFAFTVQHPTRPCRLSVSAWNAAPRRNSSAGTAPSVLRHATLSDAVEDAHRNIVARFIGPEGLLRDYEGETPTPADCRDCRPNAMGWWSPIENGPMFTGPYLEAVCARARRTGATEDRALAKKLAAGLVRAASVSDVKGMIVRGFGTDGVCHYPLGSEDQTIPWFYGLYAYWRSGIPSAAEKASVAAKVREVAEALEANGWKCPCDGAFTGQTRGAFMDNGLVFRGASHTLFLLRAVWEMTGEDKWLRHYDEALKRRQKATTLTMLEVCREGWATDVKKFNADGSGMWIYVCAQGCLARLAEMDPAHADDFRAGLARNAARARPAMASVTFSNVIERPFKYANWRTGYRWRPQKTQKDADDVQRTGDPAILGRRKQYERKTMTLPLSAAAVCAFAGAAREDVDRTLRIYDYSQINLCEFFLAEVAAERMFVRGIW